MSVDFDLDYLRDWAASDYEDDILLDPEDFTRECSERGLLTHPDFEEDCIEDYYSEYLDAYEALAVENNDEVLLREIRNIKQL